MKVEERKPHVYVVQEIAGTREGRPKFNIMGAAEYGELKFLLDERSQMIFSPGPLIFKLKQLVKHLQISGSLIVSGSDDSPLDNGAAVTIDGGINQIGTAITASAEGIIDVGFFPTSSVAKSIIP